MDWNEKEDRQEGPRLYKARRPDGEVAWVDHDELWRLQQSQAEEMRLQHARRRRQVLLTLAVLVALSLALVFLRLWSGIGMPPAEQAAEAPAAESLPVADAPGPPAAQGDAVAAETEPAVMEAAEGPPPPPDRTERVATAVRAWAGAWSSQDIAAYLGSYAASFQPPQGTSRSSWEALRRRRVLEPGSVQVEIELLRIFPLADGRMEARFVQRYLSPRYSDLVDKRLLMVEEAGEWRIEAEQAGAPRVRDVG